MDNFPGKDSRPKRFVFVLMPFKPAFNNVYEFGIQQSCERIGLHCERADKQIFEGTILDRIYNQISKADIIVADMTGQNPNVFYEVGYAHALGKRVILLTGTREDIPFDLVHYPHIIYSDQLKVLASELERRLQWMIENPRDSLSRVDVQLEIYVEAIKLTEQASPTVISIGSDRLSLSTHYAGSRMLREGDLHMAVVLPGRHGPPAFKPILLPTGEYLYRIGDCPRMFPDAWQESYFELQLPVLKEGDSYPFRVVVYTEFGPKSYPVQLVAPSNPKASI